MESPTLTSNSMAAITVLESLRPLGLTINCSFTKTNKPLRESPDWPSQVHQWSTNGTGGQSGRTFRQAQEWRKEKQFSRSGREWGVPIPKEVRELNRLNIKTKWKSYTHMTKPLLFRPKSSDPLSTPGLTLSGHKL